MGKLQPGVNDLETWCKKNGREELLQEWDYEKNEGLIPRDVSYGSGKKVWWLGECGHEWQAQIYNRAKGSGCPICNKESKTSFPEQAIFFYIQKFFPDAINSDNTAIGKEIDIYVPSAKTAIEYDGFHWHKINKFEDQKNKLCREKNIKLIRIRENGLSMYNDCVCIKRDECNNNDSLNDVIRKVLTEIGVNNNITIDVSVDEAEILESYILNKKKNSLASVNPQLASEWHPIKNCKLTPDMISYSSSKRVWWKCKSGHEWQAKINSRTSGNSCPYCGNKRLLQGYNDLKTKLPELAKEWHPTKNGKLLPNMVMPGSKQKVWWLGKCGHEWQAAIQDRSAGHGCPVCSSKRIIAGINDLASSSPNILIDWDYAKNPFPPSSYSPKSGKRAWWKCHICGYEWISKIYSRTNGHGCPMCGRILTSKKSYKKVINKDTGEIFDSIKHASEKYLINSTSITSCCHGKYKTAGGYHWKFYEEKGEENNGK